MALRGFGRTDVTRCWAGFASLGAGLVHRAVVREHLSEWWLYGAFFAVLGALQILWALTALAREAVVVVLLLTASRVPRDAAPPRLTPGARLALMGAGALVMAAITTPALAATESGEHAHPHGTHGEAAH